MAPDWKIRVQRDEISAGARLLLVYGETADTISTIAPLTVSTVDAGSMLEPTLEGKSAEQFLRAALNAAWEYGMRPDGFNDTRESMKATNAHLQDMRALAFHKIGAAKP